MWAFLMQSDKSHQDRKFDPNDLTKRDTVFVVFAVIIFLVVSISFAFSVSDDVYIKWGGLAVDTGVLFGLFLSRSQKYLRKQQFWVLTASLLVAHLAVFAFVLSRVVEWRLAWFTVMAMEYPLFLLLRNRIPTSQND